MTAPLRTFSLVVATSLAWLAPSAPDAQDSHVLEASAVPELDTPSELLREEFFALDQRGSDGPKTVGYAAMRRRREEGGQVLELEVTFPSESTRVRHVERATSQGARLVWREWRPGDGRTLVVDWNRHATNLDVIEWGRAQGLRTSLAAPDGAVMPLYLLELARHGDVEDGSFTCVEPLSRSLERTRLSTSFGARGGSATTGMLERTVELRGPDDVVVGAYTFCGEELVAFRWQAGGLGARRITADAYVSALGEVERAARAAELTVTER